MAFIVETGVKGAMRLNRKEFDNETDAIKFAARWRSSNSTGDYFAHVIEKWQDDDAHAQAEDSTYDGGF